MRPRAFLSIAVPVLLAVTTVYANSLQAVLAVDRDHTLPGLPVTLTVTIINDTREAIEAPKGIMARVRNAAGDVFSPQLSVADERHWGHWPVEYEDRFLIEAGEQRIFELPAQENLFLVDDRLNEPGRYQFQLILSDSNETSPRAIVTNAVTISVDEPSSVDGEVWRWMRATAGKWGVIERARFGRDLADIVFERYPQSQYAPYLYFSIHRAQTPARLRLLLAYHASGPYRDWIEFVLAGNQIAIVREELEKSPEKRDATRAIRAAEETDRLIADLEQRGSSTLLALHIKENREFIPSAAGVRSELGFASH